MRNLTEIVNDIQKRLDEKDEVRELALKSSRSISRMATAAIRSMHRGEDPEAVLKEGHEEVMKLKSVLEDHPDLYHSGFVEQAFQEVAEAALVHSIRAERPLPVPKELGVTDTSYLLGLADAIGELRRFALERLRTGDIASAARYLEFMEDMFEALLRFDYPTGMLSIKRKQDIARGLIEKTRGELAVAARARDLEIKIGALYEKL